MNPHQKKIDELADFLSGIESILVAIVYGSYALGTANDKSDFDLAIAGEQTFSIDEFADLHRRISSHLQKELDLIDLNRANGTVFKQALTTGSIIVLKNTNLLARINTRMIFDEQDFQSKRRVLMSKIRKDIFNA